MNSFDKFAAVATIIVTTLCVPRPGNFAYNYYVNQIAEGNLPIWFLGIIVSVYGPIALAVLFWRLAKKVPAPWLLHLLLLPAAVVLLATGERLMLAVIQDPDFDATLGGPADVPALLLFLVAIGGYFGALVAKRAARLAGRAKIGES
jgi:hypothetical protein